MADDFAVQITGLAEVQQMLREAPQHLVALGFIRAVSAGANVIADELELKTPVKKEDTGGLLDRGVLRKSIKIAYTLRAGSISGSGSLQDVNLAVAKVGFGKNGNVAAWIDGGWTLTGHKPKKTPIRPIAGTGFMRAAADASVDKAIDAVAESLTKTVRETFPQGNNP